MKQFGKISRNECHLIVHNMLDSPTKFAGEDILHHGKTQSTNSRCSIVLIWLKAVSLTQLGYTPCQYAAVRVAVELQLKLLCLLLFLDARGLYLTRVKISYFALTREDVRANFSKRSPPSIRVYPLGQGKTYVLLVQHGSPIAHRQSRVCLLLSLYEIYEWPAFLLDLALKKSMSWSQRHLSCKDQ
jgi:hypothetical protein